MTQTITATITITDEQFKSILCCAFEGGANYWYRDLDYRLPADYTFDDFRKGGRMQDPDDYWHWSQVIPLVEGCALTLKDDDGHSHIIYRSDLIRGAQVMIDKYPQHALEWLGKTNEDAITGDVFLQCVCFGEIIYG